MNRNIFSTLKSLGGFRYYVIAVVLCFAGFVWAGINGYRILGDDDESTEQHGAFQQGGSGGHGRHTRFYHK